MEKLIFCPISDNDCKLGLCAFYDGASNKALPKGRCILVRAAFALSTWEK